jgi:signal peptidase I
MGQLRSGGMNMKFIKWGFITLMPVILALSIMYIPNQVEETPQKENSIEHINIHANYILSRSLEELESRSDLIVVAKTNQPFNERNHIINKHNNISIKEIFTKTEIVILKVLKKPEELALTKNDLLTVIEPVTFDRERNVKLSYAHYEELLGNESYVIFMKKNDYGDYSIINMNDGKFKLNDVMNGNYSIENSEITLHEKISYEIKQRYGANLQ